MCQGSLSSDCGAVLAAEVDLVGGGNDGLRGAAQVFGGWVQDIATPNTIGVYQNNHQDVEIFASNVSATKDPPYFLPNPPENDPAPIIVMGPLIDWNKPANLQPATGGNSSVMSTGQQDKITLTALGGFAADPAPTLGKRILVTGIDAPFYEFNVKHYWPDSRLTDIQWNLDFLAYLTLWTSVTGVADTNGTPLPTGLLAEYTYAVALEQPWNIRSTFNGIDNQGTVQGLSNSSVKMGQAVVRSPVVPLTATQAVLGLPTAQNSDGRNEQK